MPAARSVKSMVIFVFAMTQAFLAANPLTSGTAVRAQFLGRDNGFAAPDNVGMSDAIEFTVAP